MSQSLSDSPETLSPVPSFSPAGWKCTEWAEYHELIDLLHMARVYAQTCPCTAETGSVRPCDRLFQERRPYPVAACLVAEQKPLCGRFPAVQQRLGLLQTVIHYGVHTSDGYRFNTLDQDLKIETPFFKNYPDGLKKDEREPFLKQALVAYRKTDRIQEFAGALTPKDPKYLLPLSRLPRGGDVGQVSHEQLARVLLTPAEDQSHFLLVGAGEQAFFGLLFALAAATEDATGQGEPGLRDTWLAEETTLGCLLLHDDLGGSDSKVVSHFATMRRRPWKEMDRHAWGTADFRDACMSLGLLDLNSHPTRRYSALREWLTGPADGHPSLTRPVVDLESGKEIPGGLSAIVKEVAVALTAAPPGLGPLRQLAKDLCRALAGVGYRSADGARVALLASPSNIIRFPGVRFNIPGEYLLGQWGTEPRTYFATILDYAAWEGKDGPQVGVFALGTLAEVANPTADNARLHAVRTLLRALGSFGAHNANFDVVAEAVRAQAISTLKHQLTKSSREIEGALTEFMDKLNRHNAALAEHNRSLEASGWDLSAVSPTPEELKFDIPVDFYIANMLFAAHAHPPEFKPQPARLIPPHDKEWTGEMVEQFISRLIRRPACMRALDDKRVKQWRQPVAIKEHTARGKLLRQWKDPDSPSRLLPEVRLEGPVRFDLSQHEVQQLFPYLLFVLRNAYQHSFLEQVMARIENREPLPPAGWVTICYESEDKTHVVRVENTGLPPDEGGGAFPAGDTSRTSQRGIRNDILAFRGIAPFWTIPETDGNFSRWDASRRVWVTEIRHDGSRSNA